MEKRICPECGEPLVGRRDKKFCSDFCRTAYNNRSRSSNQTPMQQIDKILHKNNRILKRLCGGVKNTSNKNILESHGYNFNYFTNIYTTTKGVTYYYCYDYGYRLLEENGKVLLVKKLDYVK